MNKKVIPLSGKNNKRLKTYRPTNNQINSAWSDINSLTKDANVSIPSFQNVQDAKDWVDNGSQL